MSYSLGFDRALPDDDPYAGPGGFEAYVRPLNLSPGQAEQVPGAINFFMRNMGFSVGNAAWVRGGKVRLWYAVPEGTPIAASAETRRRIVGIALEQAAQQLGPNVVFRAVDPPAGAGGVTLVAVGAAAAVAGLLYWGWQARQG